MKAALTRYKKWRKNRKVEVSCLRTVTIWTKSSRMLTMTKMYKMRTTEQLEMMEATRQVRTTLRWKSLLRSQTSKLDTDLVTTAPKTNRKTCKICSKGILKSDSMLLVARTSK